jgi:hypothetical protein
VEAAAQGYRIAKAEGLTGDALEARIAGLINLPGSPAWLDLAAYLEGETAYLAYHQCRTLWGEQELPSRIHWTSIDAFCDQILSTQRIDCRLRYNDWVRQKRQITRSYLEQFQQAEKEILI